MFAGRMKPCSYRNPVTVEDALHYKYDEYGEEQSAYIYIVPMVKTTYAANDLDLTEVDATAYTYDTRIIKGAIVEDKYKVVNEPFQHKSAIVLNLLDLHNG